ncbi:iron-containing alcohol dehydrogenase [Methylococcus sp. EFPC2]|uniref:iron-containing alcohol dehydrogenase n=1 Tax=Methylococcus sp. EFPC2 TaxID=2812648 RepID=UPI001966FFDE|nr:iron-containing alcohol dehydrogenase [Methylococcus sp. EFPC2]QSA97195.1 iron-containing alcohol dehydrogenase [Methylococcus sp. EFPC2]
MSFAAFTLSRLPRIEFGSGVIGKIPELAARYGDQALLITGARSFRQSPHWNRLVTGLREKGMRTEHFTVSGEPSPQLVDEAVARYFGTGISVVIAIGGGSVLDAGKAIAGLLPHGNSVLDHLEGVGRGIPYTGPATPFIAAPTTAGTGSEATKNAVLSVQGENGYKKSFRDEALVPEYAVVDPDLLSTCPPALIAADGMDAFTQLLESYVSLRANPLTDTLAWSGMTAFRDGFFHAWKGGDGEQARQGRAAIAYASLISGITLAQVGLGSVHGLAAPLGAFFPIPHGVCCGTLLAEATRINLAALAARAPDSPALAKYARVGRLLSGQTSDSPVSAHAALLETLTRWQDTLELPRLRTFGVGLDDIPRIVANSRGSSMQTNPVVLNDDEAGEIVRRRH